MTHHTAHCRAAVRRSFITMTDCIQGLRSSGLLVTSPLGGPPPPRWWPRREGKAQALTIRVSARERAHAACPQARPASESARVPAQRRQSIRPCQSVPVGQRNILFEYSLTARPERAGCSDADAAAGPERLSLPGTVRPGRVRVPPPCRGAFESHCQRGSEQPAPWAPAAGRRGGDSDAVP